MISGIGSRSDKENRSVIAEWITSVYSIFWSVWWGFFMESVLSKNVDTLVVRYNDNSFFEVRTFYFLYINVGLIVLFSYYYVRWLWSAHRTAISVTFVREFFNRIFPLIIIVAFLMSSVLLTYYSGLVSIYVVHYGILISVSWIFTVVFTLWSPLQ